LYSVGDALGIVQHHDAVRYVVCCDNLLHLQLRLAQSTCHVTYSNSDRFQSNGDLQITAE